MHEQHSSIGWAWSSLRLFVASFGIASCGLLGAVLAQVGERAEPSSSGTAEAILQRYAQAWRGEREFDLKGETNLLFDIEGDSYRIRLTNERATLYAGGAANFYWRFQLDMQTLRSLDAGRLNILTALSQARESDPVPVTLEATPESEWTDENRGYNLQLLQRFWNRDWPETVAFGENLARTVHGGNVVGLVYDEGLRAAWYQVAPGTHINALPEDRTNEFDTAVIVISGAFSAILDGERHKLSAGEVILVPAGMAHEFIGDEGEYGEFIILMYGPGA